MWPNRNRRDQSDALERVAAFRWRSHEEFLTMRRSLWNLFGVALPVAVIAFSGFSSVSAQEKKDEKKPEAKKDEPKKAEGKDIVQTAMDAPNMKTPVGLLKDADLVETLKAKGPY